MERITCSQIHVGAGEAKGKAMAEQVIRDVAELRSNRARDRLAPLADTLASHRDSQSQELAVAACRVAAARA